MKSIKYVIAVLSVFAVLFSTPVFAGKELLFVKDSIGDDKGPGYYRYPTDRRLSRGTFDIKSFKVVDDGDTVTFEIRMRNYIMRAWPDSNKTEYQEFVANMWDIYIDIDGIPDSGYKMALPGRDLKFADNMGWEKMILVSPVSELDLENILDDKIDELEFQDQVPDIVFPEYVRIQRDKVIIRISKAKLPRISERSGFQCFAMGYKDIVSPNRLINRDVKAFPTFDDFGGGSDSYGDPAIIDMIVPKGCDQYELLSNFKAHPFRTYVEYASVPFLYDGQNRYSRTVRAFKKMPGPAAETAASMPKDRNNGTLIPLTPVTPLNADILYAPDAPQNSGLKAMPTEIRGVKPVEYGTVSGHRAREAFSKIRENGKKKSEQAESSSALKPGGFVPLKSEQKYKEGFKPLSPAKKDAGSGSNLNVPPPTSGFVPLKQ